MSIFAYPEILVDEASNHMGQMFDIAINYLHYNPDEFMKMFIESGNANEFAKGSARIVSGMEGQDILDDVLFKLYRKVSEVDYKPSFHLSPEYWAGWILAQYQHYSCQSFKTITDCVSFSTLIKMYHPNHEAHEFKTFEYIDRKIKEKGLPLYNSINKDGKVFNLQAVPISKSKILYFEEIKKNKTQQFNIRE